MLCQCLDMLTTTMNGWETTDFVLFDDNAYVSSDVIGSGLAIEGVFHIVVKFRSASAGGEIVRAIKAAII